ncbi:unnamed protein product, partial [Brassica rapa subsp. trilocularis]
MSGLLQFNFFPTDFYYPKPNRVNLVFNQCLHTDSRKRWRSLLEKITKVVWFVMSTARQNDVDHLMLLLRFLSIVTLP